MGTLSSKGCPLTQIQRAGNFLVPITSSADACDVASRGFGICNEALALLTSPARFCKLPTNEKAESAQLGQDECLMVPPYPVPASSLPYELVMHRFMSWRDLKYWPLYFLHSAIIKLPSIRHCCRGKGHVSACGREHELETGAETHSVLAGLVEATSCRSNLWQEGNAHRKSD